MAFTFKQKRPIKGREAVFVLDTESTRVYSESNSARKGQITLKMAELTHVEPEVSSAFYFDER